MTTGTEVELRHRIDGPVDAPVVVLASSLGTSLEAWDPIVPALAERLRVLRYDHRGHGGSPVPPGPYDIADLARDLLALLDRLRVERASLCGSSLGAMVGMWAASEAPERFDRLVLACTSARLGPRAMWDERIAAVRSGGTAAVAPTVVEGWLTPAFRSLRPDVVESLERMLASQPAEGYAAACAAVRDLDLRGRLEAIRAPTLVIAGAQDPATPPEDHARPIAAAIPGARFELLDPAAHLAVVERPDAFARRVLEHLGA